MFRSPVPWRRLPLAVFVAAGLAFTICSLEAEYHFAKGMWAKPGLPALAELQLAARWFPLDHNYRMGPSMMLTVKRFPGSVPIAIEAVKEGLKTNPYAPDMRRNLASLLWEAGREDEAKEQIVIFHKLAPKAPVVLTINNNADTR